MVSMRGSSFSSSTMLASSWRPSANISPYVLMVCVWLCSVGDFDGIDAGDPAPCFGGDAGDFDFEPFDGGGIGIACGNGDAGSGGVVGAEGDGGVNFRAGACDILEAVLAEVVGYCGAVALDARDVDRAGEDFAAGYREAGGAAVEEKLGGGGVGGLVAKDEAGALGIALRGELSCGVGLHRVTVC